MDIEKAIDDEYTATANLGRVEIPEQTKPYIIELLALRKELQQYRQIGTVDECKAAREKQIPKEPIDDKYRHKCCPICGWLVCYDEGWGDKYVPHCENCGQALKWGD